MNERLKQVRKAKKLTQSEFGGLLGVTSGAISLLEKGERSITDQMLLAVCAKFNVSESWLRTGEGEMFVALSDDELERLAIRYNLTKDAKEFVRSFVELESEEMDAVLKFMGKMMSSRSEMEASLEPHNYELEVEIEKARELLRDNATLDMQEQLDKKYNKGGNIG